MKRKAEDNNIILSNKLQKCTGFFGSLSDTPVFTANQSKCIKVSNNPPVYNFFTLNNLISETRKYSKKDEIKLRFLLTTDYKLLFANEGIPSPKIPAHFQMTGCSQSQAKCITAGNIKINAEDKITFLSNKSGDFRPSWESLQYAFAVLFAMDYSFCKEFKIEKQIDGTYEKAYPDINAIKNEVMEKFTDKQLDAFRTRNSIENLSNENKLTKVTETQTDSKRRTRFFPALVSKKLFDDSDNLFANDKKDFNF